MPKTGTFDTYALGESAARQLGFTRAASTFYGDVELRRWAGETRKRGKEAFMPDVTALPRTVVISLPTGRVTLVIDSVGFPHFGLIGDIDPMHEKVIEQWPREVQGAWAAFVVKMQQYPWYRKRLPGKTPTKARVYASSVEVSE